MGNWFSNKYQYGKESAAARGTAVAATRMLLAEPKEVPRDRVPAYPQDAMGVRAEGFRSHVYEYLAQDTLRIPHGYFQALPALLSCGLKGNITASEQTASQGDYLWAFAPSMTADNAPDALTLERGDDTQAFEIEYVMFPRIKISGQVAQGGEESPVAIEFEYFGRQVSPTTFTPALSLPTVEPMNAKLAQFYVDASWAGVGGTEKSILRAFEIEILTGLAPDFLGSGDRFFTAHQQSVIGFMASFTLERGTDSDVIWDAFRARSLAVVRLRVSGSQIGTGVSHKIDLDLGGLWDDVIPIGENDRGNTLDKVVLHNMYDPTGAKVLDVNVITNQNTV
jgi:hypothetical protein